MKIALIVLVLACLAYYFYNSASSKKAALLNHEKGSAFLAENSKKEGVKTTASGLQYEVLQSGNGETHPSASSTVRVHYHGTLTDGTVFDSSVERDETISFPLNRVIPGWTEGLQLMKVGDKFRFFIPSGLGYGNRSAGKIPPGSVLIFDVELFEIQ
ncbi:FKBP-type peptidyl-prolyl cis-trans isomerase [Rheinheimera soli]|uniref:FKBP-type peptidyl-prolyl cis-trans isomerase n=1 Tax=Rheinheimera soli TaxID=443616 RepID=UPI001E39EA37|nr:FKBP-type peptidyl-prolyl cis-trans isomerase [Rheinheimera soli]